MVKEREEGRDDRSKGGKVTSAEYNKSEIDA